jgi:DNA-binding response OmpR family regulator
MYKLLIIEDDQGVRELLNEHLASEGYGLTFANDGFEGIKTFIMNEIDLVILDYMMPKMNGIEVLRRIRETSNVPVLMLSARDQDVDKALGLEIGADDYLGKPFSLIELSARIKALLRRAKQGSSSLEEDVLRTVQFLNFKELTLDLANYAVHCGERQVALTAKEFELLKLFMTYPNRLFTKAQIYQSVWQEDYFGDDNAINVHIRRLREKIETQPSEPEYIKTVWGIGYRLADGN